MAVAVTFEVTEVHVRTSLIGKFRIAEHLTSLALVVPNTAVQSLSWTAAFPLEDGKGKSPDDPDEQIAFKVLLEGRSFLRAQVVASTPLGFGEKFMLAVLRGALGAASAGASAYLSGALGFLIEDATTPRDADQTKPLGDGVAEIGTSELSALAAGQTVDITIPLIAPRTIDEAGRRRSRRSVIRPADVILIREEADNGFIRVRIAPL